MVAELVFHVQGPHLKDATVTLRQKPTPLTLNPSRGRTGMAARARSTWNTEMDLAAMGFWDRSDRAAPQQPEPRII